MRRRRIVGASPLAAAAGVGADRSGATQHPAQPAGVTARPDHAGADRPVRGQISGPSPTPRRRPPTTATPARKPPGPMRQVTCSRSTRPARAKRSRSSATWPPPGGWSSWCPARTPRWPPGLPGAPPRRWAAPGRWPRDRPAGPARPAGHHRLARLPHPQPAQPGRAHLGQRRAGRAGTAPAGDQPGPRRRPGRPALPQLRLGGVRAGRAASAGHRHRGVRQPGHGRLLGTVAGHHRPGVGGPGVG